LNPTPRLRCQEHTLPIMPKSAVVVAGATRSGKSRTLHAIADGHQLDGHVYAIKGRRAYIYFCSVQELTGEFCKYNMVIERVKRLIHECVSKRCDLLIIAFTMYVVKGKVNDACITKPLDYLRRRVKNTRLIYLRKETAREIDLFDRLMSRSKAKRVKSNEDYAGQAREILKVVKSLP